MQQCLIYNSSLRFSRATYGILALIAFLIQTPWLIFVIGLLMILGVFSMKFNIPYQFHVFVLRKALNETSEPIYKESGELNFAHGLAGILFFTGFLLLYSGKFVNLAWSLILIDAFLVLLACFTGICVASLMYAFSKKVLKR